MPPVPTVKPDGKRIREVREGLGLSREEVVARMPRHRHPKTIDEIERERWPSGCSKRILEELASALGRPVDEFIKAAA